MNDRLLYRNSPARFYPCPVNYLKGFQSNIYMVGIDKKPKIRGISDFVLSELNVSNKRIVEPLKLIVNDIISYTTTVSHSSLAEHTWYLLLQEYVRIGGN